jgi:hypothetical protein
LEIDILDEEIQPIIKPMVIITSGHSFIVNGKIKIEFLIVDIHDMVLPDMIDIRDRRSIGITMLIFSLIFIIGVLA